jgi:hypothetical protein
MSAIRKTLQTGSIVFGGSGLFLLILPALFLDLLALETNDQLVWSMRMIGITVFALAGNILGYGKVGFNSHDSDNYFRSPVDYR